jgi:hypothetical protein
LQEELVKTARGIGIAPSQMVQGFAQAAPRLSAHGANMEKVFKGLALQSKNTGASIDQLLGIAEGFDTFEEAARKTSQLNAMFGTQLNSVELLNATEEERIQILQSSLQATGKSIDTLGRFELKSLAQIIGVDVATVRKTFGATNEGLDDLEKKASAAKSSVNIEEEMNKSVSAQERLTAANEAFKNTVAMETIGAIRNQAAALSTNDTLMQNMADNAAFLAQGYNYMVNQATALQNQLSKVAAAQAAMDFKNTLVEPFAAAAGILGSMLGMMGTLGSGLMDIVMLRKLNKLGGPGTGGATPTGAGASNVAKAGRMAKLGRAAKFGGKALGIAGVGLDVYERASSGQSFGQITAGVGGGLAGAALGAKGGAAAGAAIGALFGGVGAVPGAAIGGFLGGIGGYFGGGALADELTGVGEIEATPIDPSTIETPPPARPALVPPRVTPQADASSAQVNALTSTVKQSLKGLENGTGFNPTFNLTAYVGGRKTASQLFVEGAKGMGVGSVSTNGTP